jgi:uncharacterized protein YgbK (DUF1537 family)
MIDISAVLGCIADDFTGATDLASNLVDRGFRTAVVFGIPSIQSLAELGAVDAVVVALKTRTAVAHEAVAESREAARMLEQFGARQFYFKYCSTFDSTPHGNIGPVIDALAGDLGVDRTIVVPSFPAAGRTVYQGHLFVRDQLLSESPMRDHPLTPMRNSNLAELLATQSENRVVTIGLAEVRGGQDALRALLEMPIQDAQRESVVIDAIDDSDLAVIADAAAGLRLVSGASGLAVGMCAPHAAAGVDARAIRVFRGRRAVLAGSASAATRAQVAHAATLIPSLKLDIEAAAADPEGYADEVCEWAAAEWAGDPDRAVLVYSSGSLDDLQNNDDRPGVADLIERMLGSVAVRFVDAGVRQLVIAGGETSGRSVSMLGVRSLVIGPAIAPGVAWSEAHGTAGSLNLALKSGNFGTEDMFTSAWEKLQ